MEHILIKISIMLVPALLAVTLHELAHGFVADKLGDPTARLLGRLTLNPVRHLDPIGTLALLFFGFGWARPVPVNTNNLRHARKDMVWVALAGPVTNFALALVSALLLRVLAMLVETLPADSGAVTVIEPLGLMAAFSLFINLILALFNLMPVPPLDGGRVLAGILPENQALVLRKIEPFGFVLIIFVVFFTNIWSQFFRPMIFFLVDLTAGPQAEIVYSTIQLLFAR